MSLFEVYDPFVFFWSLSLNWLMLSVSFLMVLFEFYLIKFGYFVLVDYILIFILMDFSKFSLLKKTLSSLIMSISLFIYILFINFIGMVPYVFSSSSHFVFSLSLAFPLWGSLFLVSWINLTYASFVHLVPIGTPTGLIFLMTVLETISALIRPWSLSIRLMANIVAGHLLMSLLGDCGIFLSFFQMGLVMFEICVAFIQAYVFSALLTLYYSEL